MQGNQVRTVLGIFAKEPRPGGVKSRLAATIGPERAAQVYDAFLRDLLERLRDFKARRAVAYSPPSAGDFFRTLVGDAFELEPQSAGDLGQRMLVFFEREFAAGAGRVVLIGSDSPDLPLDRIDHAFRLLENHELVLGPCDDGGYYLIGMSRLIPEMFAGIDWSTPAVFEQTMRQAGTLSVRTALLDRWYDVDDPKDLRRLAANLSIAADDSTVAASLPHTVAMLRLLADLL